MQDMISVKYLNRSAFWVQYAVNDNPWRRLPWTVSAALLIWAAALWSFAHFIDQTDRRTEESLPIEAQLVELHASAPLQNAQPKQHAVKVRQKAQRAVRPESPPGPQENQHADHNQSAVSTITDTAVPAINLPVGTSDANNGHTATGTSIFADTGGRAASQNGQSGSGAGISANMGARAIVRPMPQIPDDLREAAFSSVALAHFHIAVDGSVKVELVKPTDDPRLNRILLASLRNWRFAPAIKAGRPIESTEEILVRIEVK
jgi:protein TonB